MRKGLRAALLATGLLAAGAARADGPSPFKVTGNVGIGYDSNIGASQANVEKETSRFYTMFLSADYLWVPTPWLGFVVRGQVAGDAYDRFDSLSSARAIGMLRSVIKPGTSFFTPVFTFWGSGARIESGSTIRTGNEFRAGVYVTQPLTTAITGRLEFKGFHRTGEGRVFDQSGRSGVGMLTWVPTPDFSTTMGFEFQSGDSFSTAAPTIRVVRAAEVIEPDDAFGGAKKNEFAYRFDAITRIGFIGGNYRLTKDWALDAQLQSITVDAKADNHYYRTIGVVGFLVKF